MSTSTEWVFRIAGIALGVIGIVGVLWALFWDRSRGRLRCPRCRYDMAGVPVENLPGENVPAEGEGRVARHRCPECGRASSERALRRTRRRWRWAAVGLGLTLTAYPLFRGPDLWNDWPRAIPSFVLARIGPLDNSELEPEMELAIAFAQGYTNFSHWRGPNYQTEWDTRCGEMNMEGWRRVFSEQFSPSQSRAWINRAVARLPVSELAELTVPEVFPIGLPIPLRLTEGSFRYFDLVIKAGSDSPKVVGIDRSSPRGNVPRFVRYSDRGLIASFVSPADSIEVDCELLWKDRIVHTRRVRVPIKIAGTPTTFMEYVRDVRTNRRVIEGLRPEIRVSPDGLLLIYSSVNQPSSHVVPCGVAFDFEVRVDGVPVTKPAKIAAWENTDTRVRRVVLLPWELQGEERLNGPHLRVTGVFSGRPDDWRHAYLADPFLGPGKAWAGTIEIALEIDQ